MNDRTTTHILDQTECAAAETAGGPVADESISRITAKEIMNPTPRTCSRFSTVTEVVLIFKDEDCGMVPIVDAGKPLGVVTDRDVALALSNQPDLADRPAAEIMSTDVLTVPLETSALELARILAQEQVRRLLVVDSDGLLAGVVAWADLVPHLPRSETGYMVSEVVEGN